MSLPDEAVQQSILATEYGFATPPSTGTTAAHNALDYRSCVLYGCARGAQEYLLLHQPALVHSLCIPAYRRTDVIVWVRGVQTGCRRSLVPHMQQE